MAEKTCAACGKTGQDLKRCTCCKTLEMTVYYCGRDCQANHRKTHKAEIKQTKENQALATLALRAGLEANKYEKAFAEFVHPPKDPCFICMIPLPLAPSASTYMACCGKSICNGCSYKYTRTQEAQGTGDVSCAHCRTPAPGTDTELLVQLNKRVDSNDDAVAMVNLAGAYKNGALGLPRDPNKAFELYQRASALGYHSAHSCLAEFYEAGLVVVQDQGKYKELLVKAAEGGNLRARGGLGATEVEEGNIEAGIFHFRVSASGGNRDAVRDLMVLHQQQPNIVRQDMLTEALSSCQSAEDDTKSEDRELYARNQRNGRIHTSGGIMGI
eukprot:scaffold104902_cov50-Attheya_sp.AAC.1